MEESIYVEFREPDDDHAIDALRYFASYITDGNPEDTARQLRESAITQQKHRAPQLMIDAAYPDDNN